MMHFISIMHTRWQHELELTIYSSQESGIVKDAMKIYNLELQIDNQSIINV